MATNIFKNQYGTINDFAANGSTQLRALYNATSANRSPPMTDEQIMYWSALKGVKLRVEIRQGGQYWRGYAIVFTVDMARGQIVFSRPWAKTYAILRHFPHEILSHRRGKR